MVDENACDENTYDCNDDDKCRNDCPVFAIDNIDDSNDSILVLAVLDYGDVIADNECNDGNANAVNYSNAVENAIDIDINILDDNDSITMLIVHHCGDDINSSVSLMLIHLTNDLFHPRIT